MTTAAALFVERDFAVPDIRCAGCISKLEQGLVRDRRIGAARVNFTEKRVRLSCAPDAETPDLIGAFTLLGFEAQPIGDGPATVARGASECRALLPPVGVSGFAIRYYLLLG